MVGCVFDNLFKMTMLLLMFVLLAMADQLPPLGNGEEPLFPPVHPNCTQSLAELLLLRQEIQLSKMASAEEATARLLQETTRTLSEVRDSLNEIKTELMENGLPNKPLPVCDAPFTPVGETCLLLALDELTTWASGRQFCQGRGADLAQFVDANDYANILEYIGVINFDRKKVCVWIGGSDEAVEDTWLWVTGELMPRGAPFWGTTDGYRPQPGDGRPQNCAVLWANDQYYVHDIGCEYKCAPLCQK